MSDIDWSDYDPPKPEPHKYKRQANFSDFEEKNPNTPKRGSDLDAEFDHVNKALTDTQGRLRMLQREDGELRDGVVPRRALHDTEYFEELAAKAEGHEDAAKAAHQAAENYASTAESARNEAQTHAEAAIEAAEDVTEGLLVDDRITETATWSSQQIETRMKRMAFILGG